MKITLNTWTPKADFYRVYFNDESGDAYGYIQFNWNKQESDRWFVESYHISGDEELIEFALTELDAYSQMQDDDDIDGLAVGVRFADKEVELDLVESTLF